MYLCKQCRSGWDCNEPSHPDLHCLLFCFGFYAYISFSNNGYTKIQRWKSPDQKLRFEISPHPTHPKKENKKRKRKKEKDMEIPRNPAGTQHQNDVVSTSMRRDHVASTLIRRHFNVVCLLGRVTITEHSHVITQTLDKG